MLMLSISLILFFRLMRCYAIDPYFTLMPVIRHFRFAAAFHFPIRLLPPRRAHVCCHAFYYAFF